MLILNLKNYQESTGQNLDKILLAIQAAQYTYPQALDKLLISPSLLDLRYACLNYPKLNYIAQHVDDKDASSTTGWIPPLLLLSMDIQFSLYNHSEHRTWGPNILENVEKIQRNGMKLVVCCESISEAKKLLEVRPYAIAYEPPELIGTGVSVTTRSDVVKEFIEVVDNDSMPFIGAGVSTGEEIQNALSLGAKGVILSSAFVKANNHEKKLVELIQPFLDL